MSNPTDIPKVEFLNPEGNGVRILSLDGGDARCFSQLSILAELMHRLEYDYRRPVRPCEFFHSITGVGASGLVAIFLGVLGMTVEEASTAFIGICEKVFGVNVCNETCRSEIFMTEIERILKSLNLRSDSRLVGNLPRNAGCLVSICYSAAATHGCRMFRNYGSTQYSYNPTIVEAARSSWATPGLFSSIHVGPPLFAEELISAVNGFSNPTLQAVQEVRRFYGADRAVSTFLSLGSGKRGPVSVYSSHSLQRTAQQTDITEEDIEQELGLSGVYYRFSPEHTIENDIFGVESNQFGSVMSYTRAYLESVKTRRAMESYLKASSRTSTVDLNFKAEAQNAATYINQVPKTARLSLEERALLQTLSIQGLDCGSPLQGCMKGTRESILQRINDWTTDFTAPNILWIKGHPGIGKTAIATEVVEQLTAARNSHLTPLSLWRTVAYDLARKHPTIRRTVIAKLEGDEAVPTTANLENLFRHYIQDPLLGSGEIPSGRLPVVVIDALDECGGLEGQNSEHRKSLLNTLHDWSKLPTKYKLIVTSRGENDLNRRFAKISHNLIRISVGKTVDRQSSEDIRVFLQTKFQEITSQYSSLAPNWPGAENIEKLVDIAAGLFIWAQTAIKFIQSGQPQSRLEDVLKVGVSGDIDELYEKILTNSFHGPKAEALNEYSNFRSVVGTIVMAKKPLSRSSLSALLSIHELSMEHICTRLQSVLDYQNILRFHHQTFVDFLLNSNTCPRHFLIEPRQESRKLTLACLQAMKNGLCFNICGIESSYVRNVDITDLQTRIDKNIQPHLFYSSCWWANHLVETAFEEEIFGYLRYFMGEQFLHWLELLSVTKRVNQGSQMLQSLIHWISCHGQDDTEAMARDMQAFVNTFAPVISQSATHIYLSALPFSPSSLAMAKHYTLQYPRTLQVRTGGLTAWPAIQNVLIGHGDWVLSAAFSPDGRCVASGSEDKTIRIWDAVTGEMVLGPLEGHSGWVNSVAFSPDGRRLVSGSEDETIRIWDATTGEMVAGPLEGHSDPVQSVAFSPDGRHVVSGSYRTIQIWDAAKGEMVLGPLEGHSSSVESVAFSPDGRHIVSGSYDNTIRIWDAATGEMVLGPLEGHCASVKSVAFSPDGSRILSGSSDKNIRIWDATTGEMVLGPLEGHSGWVNSVAFSPDGRRLVSGSSDDTIRIWDAATGETVVGPLEGHSSNVVSSVAFSPDGRRVLSSSSDHTVRLWDAALGETVVGSREGHSGWVTSVAFSPDGGHVISSSYDKTIRIWDAVTGGMVLGPLEGHSGGVNSIAFSPDGRRLVSGSNDGTIRVWDAATGETVVGPLEEHSDPVHSLAFSPDGAFVASGYENQSVRVWDAATGNMVVEPLEGHSGWVSSVAFSPDGIFVVSGSYDRTVRVWDTVAGEMVVGPLEGHSDSVESVAFSPDGRHVVSGSYDRTIRIWDAATGEMVIDPLEGHNGSVESVAFSPDGSCIVSGSQDHTIRIWDVLTGETIVGPLKGHDIGVISVAFSPDGRRVVSGSEDETIRIWDAATGEMDLGPLEGHSDSVESVAFSPDGRYVVSGSYDRTSRIWDAATGEMVVGPLEGLVSAVKLVTFSPDGRHIVSGSNDDMIQVWDAATGETVVGPLKGPNTNAVNSVAFSPDGRRVVSGYEDETIRIWDAATGEMVMKPLKGHYSWVTSVAFSPDGSHVVSGSLDGTIQIWDAVKGEMVLVPLEGHSDSVNSVGFSPDGRRLVSGSCDSTIRIWDTVTGEMVVGPLAGHSGWVKSVAFSPDGSCIVSGSQDHTIRIWDAATGQTVVGPLEGHSGWVESVAFSPDGTCVVSGSRDNTIRIWDAATDERLSGLVTSVAFSPDVRHVISAADDMRWNAGVYRSKDQSCSFFNDTSPMQDGWVLGPNSELILWLPPPLRVGFWRPGTKLFIGKFLQTQLNLDSFTHGTSWALCKTQRHPVNAGVPHRELPAALLPSAEPPEGSNSMQLVSTTDGSGRPKRKASQNLTEATDVSIVMKKARLD